MAIAATANLALVLFDLSYVPWRNFYLRAFPDFTQVYDPIKGIEPHRETQGYLNVVNALEQQVSQTELQSPQVETLLAELRRRSSEMIETNPFALANKTGVLEKIKNRMGDRLRQESSREAFNIFWSSTYLSQAGWQQEINFFNQRIRPLIATNYYRSIGEDGEFTDEFWRIDLPFIILFSIEFLIRTFTISRRHTGISWLDAMLWRWYDIFLLLPKWRWLRAIPVIIRLHQAKLLNLEPVRKQITEGLVANVAEEVTEVVLIRIIDQLQNSIQQGELTRWLFQSANRQAYIDLNNVNEVEAIASLLINLTVYQVLPQIQPDIEALLRHTIQSVLNQSPLYRGVQNLPGISNVPQLSDQLARAIAQNIYQAVVAAVEDPVGAKISSQLVQHFGEALGSQVQKRQTIERLQSLLSDFLEEVKLNYVRKLAQEDVEEVMEETRRLRQQALKRD